MVAVKDEVVRDEGPGRVDLGGDWPGGDSRPEGSVEEFAQYRGLHAVKLKSASCCSR